MDASSRPPKNYWADQVYLQCLHPLITAGQVLEAWLYYQSQLCCQTQQTPPDETTSISSINKPQAETGSVTASTAYQMPEGLQIIDVGKHLWHLTDTYWSVWHWGRREGGGKSEVIFKGERKRDSEAEETEFKFKRFLTLGRPLQLTMDNLLSWSEK